MKEKCKNIKPIPCKVILVGDSGVGKTTIIDRYLNKYKENVSSTLSTSYYVKTETINNYKINFQIWDTVGQEQYRSLNSLFFKDAQICLMVFDITRDETFDSIKNYWYDAIQQNGLEGTIIGIAGNKNDLYAYEKVDRKEVRSFSEEIKSVFKFTSAKQNFCIKELFTELGKKFVSSKFMKEFGPEYFCDVNNNRAKSFQLNTQKKDINKDKKRCC